MWLVVGMAIGMVVTLLLLNPHGGVRVWWQRYWARVVSLIAGAGTIGGLLMVNWWMALASGVVLTLLVFRGYDQEIEIEEIEEEQEQETLEIDLSKAAKRMVNGKLVIEDE